MGLRSLKLKELIAQRRERKASKRMALRLSVLLGAAIALPFGVWQFQLHQVVKPAKTTEELAAMCGKLDGTLAKIAKESGQDMVIDDEALDYRLSECDEMGIEMTTGSVAE